MKPPTFLDLFAGAGGWSAGFEEAGLSHVAMYDFNESACNTARENFGNIVNWVDLSKHREVTFPKVDIVCGSPPCQGFSNEGYKRKDDPRNSLVWAFLEIIEDIQPDVWIFENVPGFKRSYGGHYYSLLKQRLKSWDYHWSDFILNAADYGVPQNRKRFIVIAAKDFRPHAPSPTHNKYDSCLLGETPHVNLWDAISDLPIPTLGDRIGEYEYDTKPQNNYQKWARHESLSVSNHTTQKHSARVVEKIRAVPIGGDMSHLTGSYEENSVHYCGGYRRALKNRPSYTAYWTRGMTSIHPEQHRFLSPRECARIQSFPDRFHFCGTTIENYTQICNAVPPLLARAIADSVCKQMYSSKTASAVLSLAANNLADFPCTKSQSVLP